MAASEPTLTREFCARLKEAGWMVVPIVGSGMQRPGIPDRWVAHVEYGPVWLEFKSSKRRLTGAQARFIDDANEHGAPAMVIRFAQGTPLLIVAETSQGNELCEMLADNEGDMHSELLRSAIAQMIKLGVLVVVRQGKRWDGTGGEGSAPAGAQGDHMDETSGGEEEDTAHDVPADRRSSECSAKDSKNNARARGCVLPTLPTLPTGAKRKRRRAWDMR